MSGAAVKPLNPERRRVLNDAQWLQAMGIDPFWIESPANPVAPASAAGHDVRAVAGGPHMTDTLTLKHAFEDLLYREADLLEIGGDPLHQLAADVLVGHAGFVRVGQAFEQLAGPVRHFERRRGRVALQALHQGLAAIARCGQEGPAIVAAHLQDLGEPGVFEARGREHVLRPFVALCLVDRLGAGHAQQQVVLRPRVPGQPGAGRCTAAEHLTQLEAPEQAGR